MDWITTANGLIALLTGLCGLIGTGIGAFFAIRNWIKLMKQKSAKEVWDTIMTAADAAMEQVEHQELYGEDAQQAAVEIVKATCAAIGLDINAFIDQLNAYIKDCIGFHNRMNEANK